MRFLRGNELHGGLNLPWSQPCRDNGGMRWRKVDHLTHAHTWRVSWPGPCSVGQGRVCPWLC